MSLDRKKIFEKILKLKFGKQTQEVKKQIQKLQQKIDDSTNGVDKQ
jgi:hypothetical protein